MGLGCLIKKLAGCNSERIEGLLGQILYNQHLTFKKMGEDKQAILDAIAAVSADLDAESTEMDAILAKLQALEAAVAAGQAPDFSDVVAAVSALKDKSSANKAKLDAVAAA